MKRKITFLTAALALLAFLTLPMGMRGQTTVTFTAGTDTGETSVTKGGITVSMSTMSRTDNYRCYADSDMTVTSTVGDITHIELTCTGSGTSNYGPGKFSLTSESSGTYSYSGTTGTWEGTAEGIALHASAQVRMTEIKVTYGGTPALSTYTVTYDCNGGSNCPENETDIQAGSTITLANGPIKDGYEFGGWYDGTDTYDEGDDYTVNGNVTLVAQWIDPTSGNEQWVVTNLADLTENDVFVIVGYNGSYYAMSNNNGTSSAPAPVPVTVTGNEITSTVNENMEWTYSGNATTGYTFYPEGSTSTWLYCSTEAASSNNNNIRVGTGGRKVFELNSSNYLVTKDSYVARYLSIYVNNGTAQDWRGYTTTNSAVAISFYKKVTGGVVPPSITVTNPNEIAYDATSGSFDFAVNDPVDGGQLSVSEEVDWIDEAEINNTTNGYSVTFITTTNQAGTPREGVISLTYAYGDNQTATQNVTITQAGNPNAVMTITEVRTQGTGNVVTKGVVTSITGSNNKTAYIQDASAAIVVYGNFTAAVGDEIRVSGTLQDYNGLLEITSPTVTVISSGNTTNPELMTIAEAVASTNQGWYIRIENATVTAISGSGSSQNTTIAQGQNTIVVRGNLGTSVAVNDVISGLDGNIGYYNTANQIANPQNVTVQENLLPSVTVTPATINAPAAGVSDVLTVAYENIYSVEGVVFVDADDVEITYDWITAELNSDNNVAYTVSPNDGAARTAYFKILAFDENLDDVFSNIVTVTQAEYVAPSYATLPFTFTGGKADIENTDGLTQEGLGNDYSGGANATTPLKFDHTGDWLLLQFNERPGTLNFDITGNGFSGSTFTVQISENGETYTDLASYTELGTTDTKEFTNLGENVRYIKWIYTNKASGNVGLGAINLYKYGEGPAPVASITVDPDEVNVDAEDHDGTLDLTYENLTITDMTDFDIQYYDADGEEANVPDWVEVLVAEQDQESGGGYVVSYWMMENEGTEARTAYFKVYAMDDETNLVYSNLVTVNQAAPETPVTPGTWVLTSLADLTEDDIFVIVGYNGDTYAMSNDQGTQHAPATVAVTVTEGTLSGEPDANIQWNLEITNDGYIFYPNGTTESWLYCFNDNNGVRVGTGDAKHFTLDNTSGYLTTTETTDQRYLGIYNSQDWRCYKNTTGNIAGQTFTFYKKALPANSIVIEGYENNPNPNGGWYLIASPFAVDPEAVPGMTQGDFDLYSFTDMEEAEWRNYEAEGGHFNLEPGKGYLYAHKTGVTLTFDGEPYTGDGEITLTRNENNTGAYQGWNLVGNPFTETAYIEVDRDFYVMNEAGTNVVLNESNNRTIAPMQGIFVKAEQGGETMKFLTEGTATAGEIDQKIVMNVRKDRNMVIDRAMIRFGEGRQLPKFMFNPNDTKLYIAKDNEEFAVVRSIDENSTPISFRAAEDGTYTLSVNVENVEMEYLHLIDNMTSADIDLLATPSYTFDARTTDYANRFNLVYFTYDDVKENNVQPFAFFNGSEWVINNEGSATLQVIDVTGRMLSSETFNGNARISLDQVPGVYMMRLVSGNDVKVQKVIIK